MYYITTTHSDVSVYSNEIDVGKTSIMKSTPLWADYKGFRIPAIAHSPCTDLHIAWLNPTTDSSRNPGPVFDPELRPKGGPGFGLIPRRG